jgi:hypothetical protein
MSSPNVHLDITRVEIIRLGGPDVVCLTTSLADPSSPGDMLSLTFHVPRGKGEWFVTQYFGLKVDSLVMSTHVRVPFSMSLRDAAFKENDK